METLQKSINLVTSFTSAGILEEFDRYVAPQLQEIIKEDSLQRKIDAISFAQHHLFSPFVKRVNNEEHFSKAFWRMADFSIPVARELNIALDNHMHIRDYSSNQASINVLWLIKGPFELAHMDCVKNFLYGRSEFLKTNKDFDKLDRHFVLFLDVPLPKFLRGSGNFFSFSSKKSTFLKLIRLREFIVHHSIQTIVWPSVFQDFSLYMGIRNSAQQIFWSAKYRIQILPETIDQYFYGGFSKHSKYYRGVPWNYGRFDKTPWKFLTRESLCMNNLSLSDGPPASASAIYQLRNKYDTLLGSVCTEEKYTSSIFWLTVNKILLEAPNAGYVFTGRKVLPEVRDLLQELSCRDRIHFVGWLADIKFELSMLDLYVDAFPFGAGHVLFQCWSIGLPTISLLTPENMRLSLYHSIQHIPECFSHNQVSFPGLMYNIDDFVNLSLRCIRDESLRKTLSAAQFDICSRYMTNPIGMYEDFSSYIYSN